MHLFSGQNDYDKSTYSGDNVGNIVDDNKQYINVNLIVLVNTNKKMWLRKVILIMFNDLESDANSLKLKCINRINYRK